MADPLAEQTSATLLAVVDFLRRYVVLTKAQLCVLALWALHTYVVDAAEQTPYIGMTSVEKRCGKTRGLEVLQLIAHNSLSTANASTPAVYRFIEQFDEPTLFIDEIDATLTGKDERSEEMRGILNAGNRRGQDVLRCVAHGEGLKKFKVFGPKVFAGIGELPETLADRSIPIRMRRTLPSEHVERFKRRYAEPEAAVIVEQLTEWADAARDELNGAEPNVPDVLNDRQQEAVEPLIAIADLAGRAWAEHARVWLMELLAEGDEGGVESFEQRCLRDCRDVLSVDGLPPLVTSEWLVFQLRLIEDAPWATAGSTGLTQNWLARLLTGYDVTPDKHWFKIDDENVQRRGYKVADFRDAWARFLPVGTGVEN